jgi:hypothetical protein
MGMGLGEEMGGQGLLFGASRGNRGAGRWKRGLRGSGQGY